jgi:predicted HicB family RNase H-like nuclease
MMPRSVIIGVRVPEPIKNEWQERADEEGRSLSNWIRRQMEMHVQPSSKRPQRAKLN